MLNLFRNNTLFSITGLVLITVLLRLSSFFITHHADLNIDAPLAQFVFGFISATGDDYYFSVISATILILAQALLLNYITSAHGILYKDSLLPALLYVVLNSLYPEQLFLTPQLIANTFILLLFQRLCHLYESHNPLYIVLDAGLYLGIAVLFNYDLLIYLPFILISVIIMTSFNLRYLIVAIVGMILPVYFTGVLFFLTDHFNDLKQILERSFERHYFTHLTIDPYKLAPWIILAPVFIVASFALQQNFFKNRVKTRRLLLDVSLLFVFATLSVIVEDKNFVFSLYFFSIPISIICAYYFISQRLFYLKELFFVMLLLCVVYYQFFYTHV